MYDDLLYKSTVTSYTFDWIIKIPLDDGVFIQTTLCIPKDGCSLGIYDLEVKKYVSFD